ncbi:TPA: orotidine-5'-phosphate decarboxylase [Candidatus Woesearchaeota archaeon]|nr:orotidine-5'-phosphate decarboxylase [Candidatus Woesearchaeota archaeon]
MDFAEYLEKTARNNDSIVCFGIDPVIERIPLKLKGTGRRITKFYSEMLSAIADDIAAVKPNYAYFAQYGFDGLKALEKIIAVAKKEKLPVILDAKRGDIGKSSEAYSKEVFGFWKADAVTVSPYMGTDSVLPFITQSKGVYVLVRTSNPGSRDLQQLPMKSGKELFMETAGKVLEWGTGAVVGATNISELGRIARFFAAANRKTPLLIPGVGSQGGNASEVAEMLKAANRSIAMHRINSSSGISYAYEKYGGNYVAAAEKAVKELNSEIGL